MSDSDAEAPQRPREQVGYGGRTARGREDLRRLGHPRLTMFGQMIAGSWIYAGTQGILRCTHETLPAAGARRFGGSLAGTRALAAELSGTGDAQPPAVTMSGGVAIFVGCDPAAGMVRHVDSGHGRVAEVARAHQLPTPMEKA